MGITKPKLLLVAGGFALLCACEDSPTEAPATPVEEASGPGISQVILNRNPNPTVPLAAILSVTTDIPTMLTVRIDDGERQWDATTSDGYANVHSLEVLGMRAGRMHRITGVVTDEAGNRAETPALPLEMPPLPDYVPVPRVLVSDPQRMEPGVTLFNPRAIGDDGENVPNVGLLVIVDDRGEVIWYMNNRVDAGDARRIANGNIFYGYSDALIAEIDMLGNVINHWHTRLADPEDIPPGSIPLQIDTMHHEMLELPSGNLLTLSHDIRIIEDYPASESDPDAPAEDATVVGDVIVELARDGTVVHHYSLLDLLDPYRIGYASLSNVNQVIRDHFGELAGGLPMRDWSHSNAVSYDPHDDSFIVSVRHQDAVVKVDRATGELVWIMGTHDNWKEPWHKYLLAPQGDLEWQYHEHGPEVGDPGSFVMFDNGNGRASPFTEELPLDQRYSRAVEFQVDRDTMTISQPWAYGDRAGAENWFYSRYISDADWLPVTNNVLVVSGGQRDDENGVPTDEEEGSKQSAQIFEVTRGETSEKVFHIVLEDEPPAGFQVYRAQRLPSLYPQ